MLCERACMRFGSIVVCILLVLLTLAMIVIETNIDLAASVLSMPPPVVLLVCGVALVVVGDWIRKWLGRHTSDRAKLPTADTVRHVESHSD